MVLLTRDRLEVVGSFGGHGGHGTGQFFHIHSIAIDSKGDIYLGESFGNAGAAVELQRYAVRGRAVASFPLHRGSIPLAL